jgi:SAM-dependent methyltransferase
MGILKNMKWKFLIMRMFKSLQIFFANLRRTVGIYPRLKTHDRQVLEKKILPFFATSDFHKTILFVGCEWYTKYYRHFFSHKNYWTIDIDPSKAQYGANQHICDAFQNIHQHFKDESLDLIVCNGVFGWGLNEKKEIEQAYQNAYSCLKEEGILVVGWNNIPEVKPCVLGNYAMSIGFEHYVFPALNASNYPTYSKLEHVFDFYIKRKKNT